MAQLIGTIAGVGIAIISGFIIYGVIRQTLGLRLSEEEEFDGSDLAIHRNKANPEV